MTDSEVRIVFVGSSGDAVAETDRLTAALRRLKSEEQGLARAQAEQAVAAKAASKEAQSASAAQVKAARDSQTAEMKRLQMIESARNQMTRDFNEQRSRELAMRQDLAARAAAEQRALEQQTAASIRSAANAQREANAVKRSVDSQLRDRARQAAAEARTYEQERSHDLMVTQARQMMERDLAKASNDFGAFTAGLRSNTKGADDNRSAYQKLDSVIKILPSRVTLLGGAIAAAASASPALVGALAAASAALPPLLGGLGLAMVDFKSLGLSNITGAATKVDQIQQKLAADQTATQAKLTAGTITAKQAAKDSANAQITAAKETRVALAGLTAEQRAALPAIRAYQNMAQSAAHSVQAILLPAIGALAPTIKSVAPVIESGMVGVAKEIRSAASEAAAFAQTPLFKQELGAFLKTSEGEFGAAVTIIGHLGAAFLATSAAAQPFVAKIGEIGTQWATMLQHFAESFQGQQAIHSLLSNGITDLGLFGRTVGVLLQTIGRFGVAAVPALRAFADELHHVLGGLDTFVGANQSTISAVLTGLVGELHSLIGYIQANGGSIGTILTNAFHAAQAAVTAFNAAMQLAGPAISLLLGVVAGLTSVLGGAGLLGAIVAITGGAIAFKGAMAGVGAAVAAAAGEMAGADIAFAAAGGAIAAFADPLILIPAAILGLGAVLHILNSGLNSTRAAAQAAADALQGFRDEVAAGKDASLQAQVAEHAHSQAVHAVAQAHDAARASVVARNAAEKSLTDAIAHQKNVEADANATTQDRARAAQGVVLAHQKLANATADVSATYTTLQNESDALKQADLTLAATHARLATEAQKVRAAHETAASAFDKADAAARKAANQIVNYAKNNANWTTGAQKAYQAQIAQQKALDAYVQSNLAATGPMAAVNHALADLAVDLGKIPPKKVTAMILNEILHGESPKQIAADIAALHSKSIAIDVTTVQQTYHHDIGGTVKRASGGYIPGMPSSGDVVPALLTGGEVVLNSLQQSLVGHGRIADALRSTGAPNVPRFASGTGPLPHKPPKLPHHSSAIPHPHLINDAGFPFSVDPGSVLGKAVEDIKDILARIQDETNRSDDAQKAYDLLTRQYDIEAPDLTKTIPDPSNPGATLDVRDEDGIKKRAAQIYELIAKRSAEEGQLYTEGNTMREAIKKIQRAMGELATAIKQTVLDMQAERKAEAKAKQLEKQAKDDAAMERSRSRSDFTEAHRLRDLASTERQKGKKANVKQINAWETQARAISDQARDHGTDAIKQDALAKGYGQEAVRRGTNAERLQKRITGLQTASTAYGSQRDSLTQTLLHDMPFTERGMVLDVEDLQHQVTSILGTQSQASSPAAGGAAGSASGGTTAGLDTSALDQQVIALLQTQLSQANQALGTQRAQVPVLASFRSGVMHVPEDMVAQLHAGERVVRSGVSPDIQAASPGGGSSHLHISVDEGALEGLLKAQIKKATPGLLVTLGDAADTRRREGRY